VDAYSPVALSPASPPRAYRIPKPARYRAPGSSSSDPEARLMKQPDGGFAPSYNVQTTTSAVGKAIDSLHLCRRNGATTASDTRLASRRSLIWGDWFTRYFGNSNYFSRPAPLRPKARTCALYLIARKVKFQAVFGW
jgi:hypothetical protein